MSTMGCGRIKEMKKYRLEDFKGGWFIGNFEPSLVKTEGFEVAVKHYKKGDTERKHIHKLADEFTVIISGKCRLNGEVLIPGDIALLEKSEPMTEDFKVLEDTVTTVVKIPSVIGDKYEV